MRIVFVSPLHHLGLHGYEIHSDGTVWSRWNRDPDPRGRLGATRYLLKPGRASGGYLTVSLRVGYKKYKSHRVHRLVALAFLPNPESLSIVDHIDGDRENNRLENLRWCSIAQNSCANHKLRGGKTSRYKGVSRTPSGRWAAQITARGETHRLGTFAAEEEAARAYDEAASRLHGAFHVKNSAMT